MRIRHQIPLIVLVSGTLLSAYPVLAQFAQQGPKLVGTGAVGDAYQGFRVSLSGDGNTAIVGGTQDNGGVGAVWVWTRSGGVWTQQGTKLVGSGAIGNAGQGCSVSLSADGNTALVGGNDENGVSGSVGAVWVWTRSGGVWSQQGTELVGSGAVGGAQQGCSVSLSADGNTALVGGDFDNIGAGAAWVWTRSGGVWTQQGTKLVGSGAVDNAQRGYSVSLSADGNTALVGGVIDSDGTGNAGAAWVWTRSGRVWTQQGTKLVGSGAVGYAHQGGAVSLSGDGNKALVGGAYDNEGVGAVWVWTRSGGVWTQQGTKLVGSGTPGGLRFGGSVSLSADGRTAIVGGTWLKGAWVYADVSSTTSFPQIAVAGGIDFGACRVGSDVTKELTIRNTGGDQLIIQSLTSSGPQFQVVDPNASTVPPGGSRIVTVHFVPQEAGRVTSTLTIHSNDPWSPSLSVPVTGVGQAVDSNDPVADFIWSPDEPIRGQSVSFIDRSDNGASWSWSYGDGSVSSTRNPSHTFTEAGSYPVVLSVGNAYGKDTATKTLIVKAPLSLGPSVKSSVHRELAGFFLKGSGATNRFDVDVDWKGQSPGRLEFLINGTSLGQVEGNTRGGSRTFQLDSEFTPSWAPSTIGILPIGSDGTQGQLVNERLYVFPLPTWLDLGVSAGILEFQKRAGELKATVSHSFPDPPLRGTIRIPDAVPFIGGTLGFEDTYASLEGSFSSTGQGSAGLSGQMGFQAAGQTITGSVGGTCSFVLGPPSGLELTGGTFSLGLSGTIRQELGILDVIPPLAPVAKLVPTINNAVKLVGSVSPGIDATTRFSQKSDGRLGFSESTFEVGIRVEGGLKATVGVVTAYGYVAADGHLTVGVPAPYLRELQAAVEAGAKISVDMWFANVGYSGKVRYGCSWENGGSVRCGKESEGGGGGASASEFILRDGYPTELKVATPEYARYGHYSAFQATTRAAARLSPRTPVNVELSTLASNIYADASPQIAKVGNGQMLVWTHQDLNDEVVESSEIAYSWSDGTNWTPIALVTNDTRPERKPVIVADRLGHAIVAWARYKDAHVSPVPTALDDLPAYFKRFEVVTARYDPVSASWSLVRTLTNNSSADLDPQLAAGGTEVLLTWLRNIDGVMVSTPDSPSMLMYAVWDGTSWGLFPAIDSNMVGVSGHVSAMTNGEAFVIVPVDLDPETSGDERLDLYTWSGGNWSDAQVFASGERDRAPSVAYDEAGVGHVVWLRSGDLVHATLNDPTPHIIRAGSSSMGFLNTRLMTGPNGLLTVVWQQETETGPANIYALIYDSQTDTWSADRRLTDMDALAYSISGFHDPDGALRLAYMSQQLEKTSVTFQVDGESFTVSDVPNPARADLELLEHSLIVDLATASEEVSVTPSRPPAGAGCVATVIVHNAGDFAVGPFAVDFYAGPSPAGGVLLGTQTVDLLNAGAQTTLAFEFIYPETAGDLIAVIDRLGQVPEFSETNNQAAIYLSNRPPVPSFEASVTSGTAPLTVYFDASKTVDLDQDQVGFHWTFADGESAGTGAQVSHTFTQPGKYLVTLVATDNRGAEATSTVTISVKPSRHFFPFARWEDGSFTGYAVANHSVVDTTVELNLNRPGAAAEASQQIPLSAGRQYARLGSELFPQSGQVSEGWVEMAISQPELGSLFQFGTGAGLDGGLSLQRWSKKLYWTRVFDGPQSFRGHSVVTKLSLANPTAESVRVRLRLFARPADAPDSAVSAVQIAEAERTLISKASVQESIADLFGNVGQISDGFVVGDVLEGPGLVGFELIELTGEATIVGLGAFPSSGDSVVSYSAQLAELGGVIYTNLRLINVTADEVTVILTAIGDDGQPLTDAPVTVVLPPWGLLQKDTHELFQFPPDQLKVGTLRVEATTPGVVGDAVFGAPDASNAAAIALQQTTFRKATFNHVGNLPGILYTGLALCNPGNQDALVQISVYTSEGALVGQESCSIPAGRRFSKLVDEIVPSSSGQAGGYLVLESSDAIIGQMLFGASDMSYLSAVPPTIEE